MISIVIPIFNEKESLQALFRRIRQSAVTWETDYEVILVDDGSSDGSGEIIQGFSDRDPRFRGVRLSRNFGHQAAVSAGLAYAQGEAVIIMDGDLQDPPEVISRFLEKWRQGYKVVYAVRKQRKENLPKRVGYLLFYRLLTRIAEIDIPLDSGDFCLLDRKVVNALRHTMPENIRFVRGLRAYAGFKSIGIEYERSARIAGKPKYTLKRLIRLASDGIFGFSVLPLRLATYLGMSISTVSFALGIFFIVHRILDFKILGHSPSDTPGLASLAVGMFFLGGVLLIFLGILGEYVGRIYIEVKRRPAFIVDELSGFSFSGKHEGDTECLSPHIVNSESAAESRNLLAPVRKSG